MRRSLVPLLLLAALAADLGQAQTWRPLVPAGGLPPRRNAAAICDPSGDRVLLFGGRGSSGDRADLWALDLATDSWSELPAGAGPSPRFTHVAVHDPVGRDLVVWSGRAIDSQGTRLFDDVWVYDLQSGTWRGVATGDPRPARRYGSAAIYDPRRRGLVAFAGFTDEGRFEDTWRLDLESGAWRQVAVAGTPGRRCLHSAAYDPVGHRMLVYGGQRTGALGDLWALDLEAGTWAEITPVDGPPARFFAAAAYQPGGHRLLIFGGDTGAEKRGDLWAFDLAAGGWEELHPGGPAPAPRDGAVAVFVPSRGRLVLFGGTSDQHLGDTWYLDGLEVGPPSTAVEDGAAAPVPLLLQAYPNPVNGQVTVRFAGGPGRLEVRDLLGQLVRRLSVGDASTATGEQVWDGCDAAGRPVASGVYVIRLATGQGTRSARVVVAR
ncbi:MAG: kelch repeat-containing protein [Gemmatimonadota bacterium]